LIFGFNYSISKSYIIEERLSQNLKNYKNQTIKNFVDLVSARTSIPGGGCVAALVSSLGSSLATMASYLTYGNRKYESLDSQIRELLPVFYKAQNELMELIDQDALAFNSFVVSRFLDMKKYFVIFPKSFKKTL
jgi:glutamate formiminotransferase/formiminotetrahydrofolate cyclodeaminase